MNRDHHQALSTCVESLERRLVLSCTTFVEGSTLFVHGDELSNTIRIVENETGVEVKCDGQPSEFFADVTEVIVDTAEGNDTVSADLIGKLQGVQVATGAGGDRVSLRVAHQYGNLVATVDLGPDSQDGPHRRDRLKLHFQDEARQISAAASLTTGGGGEFGFAYLVGDDVNLLVGLQGTSRSDAITLDVNVTNGNNPCVTVVSDLGDGHDSATIRLAGRFEDIALTSTLGAGNDSFRLNLDPSRVADQHADPRAVAAVDIDAGEGRDRVDMRFKGKQDSQRVQADLRVATHDGADRLGVSSANMTFAGYELIADLGEGNDLVRSRHQDTDFYPPDPIYPPDPFSPVFVRNLDTGSGADRVRSDLINVHIDGSGRSEIYGGTGNDIIRSIHRRTTIDEIYSGKLAAGEGDDVIISRHVDGSFGSLDEIVDGGLHRDRIRTQLRRVGAGFNFGLPRDELHYDVLGGGGDDRIDSGFFDTEVEGPFDVTVDGGDGRNNLQLDVSDVSVAGSSNIVIFGGAGRDNVGLTQVDLTVGGDGGSLLVDTGDDADVIDVTLRDITLDDTDYTAVVDAGEGDDVVNFVVEFAPGSTGSFDGQVFGRTGDDRLIFELYLNGVTLVDATLDGGNDFDTCQTVGPISVLSCEA